MKIIIYICKNSQCELDKGKNKREQNNNTLKIMRRYITIDAETRRQLIRKYNVGRRTIWEALSFITRNKRGDSIRRDALAMGGEYREEDFVPDCQTEFLQDGMHQRFATGVEVVTSGNRMSLVVPAGQGHFTVRHFYGVELDAWGNVLAEAQEIARKRMLSISDI